MKNLSTDTIYPHHLQRSGGAWVGAARTWMQTRFRNGEFVTWGSNDLLEGAPVTVADIEEVAAIAAAAALNDARPRYADVLAIWGWRCAIDPIHISVPDMAGALYRLCERLDMLGHSFNSFPGGAGGFGVLCDAAPSRDWALLLDTTDGELRSLDSWYWSRILSVLCSRLCMAEVRKLPGYDHDARPDGAPFTFPQSKIERAATAAMDAIQEAAR